MSKNSIVIAKNEFKLRVLGRNDKVLKVYDIAIGERRDGLARIYEEDFRTPEGCFKVNAIFAQGSPGLAQLNRSYYPFYLAHRMGDSFADLGDNAYGSGLIALSYPAPQDLVSYQKLTGNGSVRRDWQEFMEEKWRGVFEHLARKKGIPFPEMTLSHEKCTGERSFLEGKTFDELCALTPPEPRLGMGIHGTNDPACIGHKISGGCVRMHNKDFEELLNYVRFGTPVEICH
jgi:hypothetical protein